MAKEVSCEDCRWRKTDNIIHHLVEDEIVPTQYCAFTRQVINAPFWRYECSFYQTSFLKKLRRLIYE